MPLFLPFFLKLIRYMFHTQFIKYILTLLLATLGNDLKKPYKDMTKEAISGDEHKEEKLRFKQCSQCGEWNSPAAKICHTCGMILDKELMPAFAKTRKTMDDVMSELMSDKEVQELMKKKIMELGLAGEIK
jgi:hypothetical protein